MTAELQAAYAVDAMVQGEMASFYIEQDICNIEDEGPDSYLPEVYEDLLNEYDRRKLKRKELR